MRRRHALSFASHEHFIFVSRAFHLRRTCVFSCIARVPRFYLSNTSLHPGIEMGTCKMQESKGLHIPAKYWHPVGGQERSSSTPGAVMLFTPGHFATRLTLT